MRYLCIDLGDKRTGLAVGDDETQFIAPIEVINVPRGPRLIEAITQRVAMHDPHELVIGLPLNMNGSEGPAAKTAREFAAGLAKSCSLPIHFQDERLTSHAADEQLAGSGRTRKQKKQIRDALAAAEILRDFLASR